MRTTTQNNNKTPFIFLPENVNSKPAVVSIFRTSLKTLDNVKYISSIFDGHPNISSWSVDIEDIDNVLRVESRGSLNEKELIAQVRKCGFFCQLLPD